jgi:hypothetical protein
MDETDTDPEKVEGPTAIEPKKHPEVRVSRTPPPDSGVSRDELGRFCYGHGYLPITQDGVRNAARKAFLDSLNGIAGEKRLLRIAEIAEGQAVATALGRDGEVVEVSPSIREQLDANTTLLYLQHGRPAMQVDVQATHTVKVRWNPDKYERVEDLEKYLELQRIGEVVDAEVVKTEDEGSQ